MLRLPLAAFHPLTLLSNPAGGKGTARVDFGVAVSPQRARAGGPSPPWCFHPSPVSFPRAPLSSQGKAGQLGKAHFSNVCSTAR